MKLSLFGLLLGCLISSAQVTGLSFRPADANYSLALDRIILISASPNQLHIYNPAAQSDQIVALSEVPLNLSLSPDGTHAAVAYTDAVAYVDLQAGAVLQTFSNIAVGTGKVIFGAGYIYVFPSYVGSSISINIASGQSTVSNSFTYVSGGAFDSAVNAIYSTQDGISPNSLNRYDASAGAIGNISAQPFSYFNVFSVCGPLTLSHDGATIYTGCGTVFSSSADQTKDMRYLGTLSGLNAIQSLATSDSLNQVAAIPKLGYSYPPPPTDAVVDLFDSSSLNLVGQLATTPFRVGSTSYVAHARWAFYNSSSSSIFIVTQADSSAGLETDFALETVDLANPNSCGASFAGTSASAIAAGSYATAQILSGEHCRFTAVSNASWLVLASGYAGSGNTTLTYLARANLSSSSRSGTITIGSQTFTVTQDAAPAPSALTPLSFKPVAANYDGVHGKIVIVASSPNELHIYDPVTQSDQIVPLAFSPLSVSVRPDGLFAAVGQGAHISIVDLQSPSVVQTIPIDMNVVSIVLASNGYVYGFSGGNQSALVSIQLTTGTQTLGSSAYSDTNCAWLSASGTSIYTAGTRYDITTGPAIREDSSLSLVGGSNFWLSQDGNRMVTSSGNVFFTSPNVPQDFGADGSLSSTTSVAWAANSQALQETAVLSGDTLSGTDTQLQIYSDNGLQLQNQLAMPSFSAAGASYVSHGRFLFWNATSTKLFAIIEADSASGLLSDYAVYTVDSPSSLPACTYAVSPSTLNVGNAFGTNWFFNVTSNCTWKPAVTSNWLQVASGSNPVTGNAQVYFYPQANSGIARSSSIIVGNQTVTVNQAASTCSYTLSSTSQSFSQAGGSSVVSLTTGSGCAWSVESNASWLTVSGTQSGTGSAAIHYTVAPNTTSNAVLDAALNIAGNAFSVNEITVPVSVAMNFVPVTPCRIADTRLAAGAFGGPYLSGQTSRDFSIWSSSCHIPSTAIAYSLNVTVVPHGGLGYLTVWPAGEGQPLVSTLNSDGRVKANAAIVPAGNSGSVSFYASNDTDLVIDINGYFVDAASNSGLEFYPLTPCRISDTRNANGELGGPALLAGQSRDLPILQSSCGVPSSAQAYSLNFTAVPEYGLGYLATWPAGQTQPLVSTLNASTGAVTANASIVPAGTNGNITVFASDNSHLVVDINGYFAPPGTGGLHFYTIAPCRVLDTRFSGADQPFNGTLYIPVAGSCNIPSNASAVVSNTTVIPQSSLGFITVWPYGLTQPLASTLNADDGTVTSNMAIVPMASGAINVFASASTHLVLDVTGYFAP